MECIVCMNSDDVLEYNHCGKYKICNECLSVWKKKHKNKCIICNKVVKGFSLKKTMAILCLGRGYHAVYNDDDDDEDVFGMVVLGSALSYLLIISLLLHFNIIGIIY